METITLKLLDDNPLIPPKCSEVVVLVPAKYEQNLYDALGGACSTRLTSRDPDVVFTEYEARNLSHVRESQDKKNPRDAVIAVACETGLWFNPND